MKTRPILVSENKELRLYAWYPVPAGLGSGRYYEFVIGERICKFTLSQGIATGTQLYFIVKLLDIDTKTFVKECAEFDFIAMRDADGYITEGVQKVEIHL